MKTQANHIATADAVKAISQWVSADSKAGQTKVKAVDLLVANGVTAADLTAPAKGEDRTVYESYCAAIVAGFAPDAKKLVTADKAIAKGFSDEAKQARRYWQQQIGSKLKDLRRALESRLAPTESGEADGEATAKASDAARLLRDVTAWINRLEKAEATALPVVDCLKHLKALAGIASAAQA